MKILFDICHPAHAHVFLHPIKILKAQGHTIIITSRFKDIALELLDELELEHIPIAGQYRKGILALGLELLVRDFKLYRLAKKIKPDIMVGIGGIFVSQISKLTGIPSLAFYDTENATLQNLLTYPFADIVIVPECYEAWLPSERHIRYKGYHELSYLHPNQFTPDRETAIRNGLDPDNDNFFIRVVSWDANHDVGENGWTSVLLTQITDHLAKLGKVHISSERELPETLQAHCYKGNKSQVHHVMAHCRLFIGESATMASECAVLGVPAIYAAETGRGYTTEQEKKYGLVTNITDIQWPSLKEAIDSIVSSPGEIWNIAQKKLLDETINVASFISATITDHKTALLNYQNRKSD